MSVKFKLKPLAIAMMPMFALGSATLAHAQEQASEDQTPGEVEQKSKKELENELEVIEVSGYRGSILRSINAKRLADGVQDSIFAEDIGKSTDQNIADALSRISGVTVQEADGEGTRISVRGANAALNQVSLNGIALTSGLNNSGSNQSISDESVDLSTFSSDILSSINVIKTAAADHDEGSLGANVILKTFKPLNVAEDRRSIEVQGRRNDYAERNNFKISGTFSEKFMDDKLGVILTASKETQDTRRDSLGGDWLSPYEVVRVRDGGARNLNGDIISGDRDAIIANGKSFNTFVNSRDRDTATLGIQFLPTDVTDVQLDLSYSKQKFEQDSHSLSINTPDYNTRGNFFNHTFATIPDAQAHLADANGQFTDPQQDWWTIDEAGNTVVKALNRFGGGSFGRQISGNETENKVATLKISHELTESFFVELTAGYSKTDFNSLPNASLRTANWARVPEATLGDVPLTLPDGSPFLQPVGFDCSTGQCVLVTGDQPVSYVPRNGGAASSNISPTGFSPYDLSANHLGGVSKLDEIQTDINKTVFLDFDWEIEFFGVTSVEFGAKYSDRAKDVFTDYQDFSDNTGTVVNPVTGEIISGQGPADIFVADVIGGTGLPVNNFMDDLLGANASQYNTNYLNGWAILDPVKAFAEMFSIPDITLNNNTSGDRRITQENQSAYLKFNFEYFDSRLTGNVGVRYVRTENESFGNSTFVFNGQDVAFDPIQLIYDKQLANTNLDPCPAADYSNGRVVTADPSIYPCYDSGFSGIVTNDNGDPVDRGFVVSYDANGNVIDAVGEFQQNDAVNNSGRSWFGLWHHRDDSTQTAGENTERLVAEGIIGSVREINNREFKGTGEHKSEIWLPSLNLNYAVNEEIIARFAASKTMARPRFDSLRPGFNATENLWGTDTSTVRNFNPKLEPLTSNNIDISLEWYFNKAGLVSLAFFHKDMKNFEEQVRGEVFLKDVRTQYGLESITLEEAVINPGVESEVVNPFSGARTLVNEVTPFNSDCLPHRVVQVQITRPLAVECRAFQATILRNGSGAKTKGLEFSYNQSYDFLPGVFSGLGTNFNYTFSDSETKAEFEPILQLELASLPQAFTPRHSANTTLYWEKDGHQLRFSHRFNSDQLRGRVTNGVEWQDSTSKLDFSASYKWDENLSFTFHALNITDDVTRTYFTSQTLELRDGNGVLQVLDEGNALEDDVYEGRTIGEFKTGRQFRISARYNF